MTHDNHTINVQNKGRILKVIMGMEQVTYKNRLIRISPYFWAERRLARPRGGNREFSEEESCGRKFRILSRWASLPAQCNKTGRHARQEWHTRATPMKNSKLRKYQ